MVHEKLESCGSIAFVRREIYSNESSFNAVQSALRLFQKMRLLYCVLILLCLRSTQWNLCDTAGWDECPFQWDDQNAKIVILCEDLWALLEAHQMVHVLQWKKNNLMKANVRKRITTSSKMNFEPGRDSKEVKMKFDRYGQESGSFLSLFSSKSLHTPVYVTSQTFSRQWAFQIEPPINWTISTKRFQGTVRVYVEAKKKPHTPAFRRVPTSPLSAPSDRRSTSSKLVLHSEKTTLSIQMFLALILLQIEYLITLNESDSIWFHLILID